VAIPQIEWNGTYFVMAIGMIGATIAPWMQFYLQSAVVEKNIPLRRYPALKLDVIIGSVIAVVVAFFILICCAATLFASGHHRIADAAEAAVGLRPLAGTYATVLFAFGLFNASIFAASILPLSTAFFICEGLGFEAGVDKRFDEAPVFYWLYTALIVVGAGLILVPGAPLVRITVLSQVANGVVLPYLLIFMLLLVNRRDLMADRTNPPAYNFIAWLTCILLIAMTAGLLYLTFRGGTP
jgi:Mn2+/Fe2+ NRAMP family transporter